MNNTFFETGDFLYIEEPKDIIIYQPKQLFIVTNNILEVSRIPFMTYPIPINDEILIACGFKKDGYDFIELQSNTRVSFSRNGYVIGGTNVNSIHEIQQYLRTNHQIELIPDFERIKSILKNQ